MTINVTPVQQPDKPVTPDVRKIQMVTKRPSYIQQELPKESGDVPKNAISDIEGQVETSEDTKPLSPQFAALAKQRRALQVKESELAEREKAVTSTQSGKDSWIDPAKLKSEPLSVLLQHGVTYDQLTEAILASSSGVNPEIQVLKDQIKALEEGVDKKLSDKDKAQEQQVLAEMRKEAEQLAAEGEDFEMVRLTNSVSDVVTLIERTYRQTGEVLEVKQAMQLVEDELINESLLVAGSKKVQGRLVQQQPQGQAQKQQPQASGMKTLTNRDGSQPPMTPKQRALAAFAGTLKK